MEKSERAERWGMRLTGTAVLFNVSAMARTVGGHSLG